MVLANYHLKFLVVLHLFIYMLIIETNLTQGLQNVFAGGSTTEKGSKFLSPDHKKKFFISMNVFLEN